MALVMDPHRDWSWIYRMGSPIRSRHQPARPKRHRLVPARELFDLGLGLIARAERERTACGHAVVHRDGLLVALLAARPLRLRNLAGLAFDRTLISAQTIGGSSFRHRIPKRKSRSRCLGPTRSWRLSKPTSLAIEVSSRSCAGDLCVRSAAHYGYRDMVCR